MVRSEVFKAIRSFSFDLTCIRDDQSANRKHMVVIRYICAQIFPYFCFWYISCTFNGWYQMTKPCWWDIKYLLLKCQPKFAAGGILFIFFFFFTFIFHLRVNCLLCRWFTWNVNNYFLWRVKKSVLCSSCDWRFKDYLEPWFIFND